MTKEDFFEKINSHIDEIIRINPITNLEKIKIMSEGKLGLKIAELIYSAYELGYADALESNWSQNKE